jgi:hypothetical protein
MSKLTDKIEVVQSAVAWDSLNRAALQAHLHDILADVKELEQRADQADEAYGNGYADGQRDKLCVEKNDPVWAEASEKLVGQAKREAYEHAVFLIKESGEWGLVNRLLGAIDALGKEGENK